MDEFKNVMLVSPTKVKKYAVVGLNVDDSVLGNCIRLSHIHLKDVIGTDLVERLQELVYNKLQSLEDTIDDDDNVAYKTLLDEYVVPALAYATASETSIINELKLRNMGTVKNSDTNVNSVSNTEYEYLASYYKTYLNDAYNRMMEFLCENKDAFDEIDDGFCTCSSKPLYANTNLWLGE